MEPAPSLDLAALVGAVQQNCDLSDAQHAGDLTLCTFLLKMRELYRWEQDLPLTRELPRAEVGEWMNRREQHWEGLGARPYAPLPLPGGDLDPFESEAVNARLRPHGLVYSGGYGRQCKPHFFLGRLLREEDREGLRVRVSTCEYARDLDAPPGMLLDGTIFVRLEALRRWLWERYEEWRWSGKNPALGRALACHPFQEAPEAALDAMTETQAEAVILHELGEARVGAEFGEAWAALLADLFRSRAEIMARAARDLLADCQVTLPGLLERNAPALIHFHFANFVGMRRKLFPELAAAYQDWVDAGSTSGLEHAVRTGRERWRHLLDEMLEIHARQGDAAAAEIERRIGARFGL